LSRFNHNIFKRINSGLTLIFSQTVNQTPPRNHRNKRRFRSLCFIKTRRIFPNINKNALNVKRF